MDYQSLGVGRHMITDQVRPFLVTLARHRPAAQPPLKRAQVVERGMASSQAFCQHLIDYVDQTDRRYELVQIGDPTAFGIVSIVSTKELADAITRFPEVESVIEDTASLVGLIR